MILRLAACAAAAVVLAGCELIKAAEEPVDLYQITPKSTFDPGIPAVYWQLAVVVPQAAANLNTGRITLAHSPTQFDYYAKVAWTDRAPAMVQTRIIDSFENSGKIAAVARAASVPLIGLWLDGRVEVMTERVLNRAADASDATVDVLMRQIRSDTGPIEWHRVDASGSPEAVEERAASHLRGALVGR